jgi:hypothetical protein
MSPASDRAAPSRCAGLEAVAGENIFGPSATMPTMTGIPAIGPRAASVSTMASLRPRRRSEPGCGGLRHSLDRRLDEARSCVAGCSICRGALRLPFSAAWAIRNTATA